MTENNNCFSSSFGSTPFDDSGRSRLPNKRTTTTFSRSYDTLAIDPFRQGVEVTTNKHRFAGMLPKIGAGNICHQTEIRTYGQANNSIDREQSIIYEDKRDNNLSSIINVFSRSSDVFTTGSSGLVAWFPLNNSLGSYDGLVTLSASYNSNNVSYSAGPISGTYGLYFQGTSQPMFGSTYAPLKLTGSLSIELLWKPTAMNVSPLGDNHTMVSWGPLVFDSPETEARNFVYSFGFDPYNSRMYFAFESGSASDTYSVWGNTTFLSNSANWNQWYHMVLTKNATTKEATLYISGTSYGAQAWSPSYSGPTGGTSCLFRIGGNLNSPQTDLSGTLAHVRVYNRELSQAEVRTFYNQYLTATLEPYVYSGSINLNYPIELNGQEDPNDATLESLTIPFKKPNNEPLYYSAHASRGNIEDGNEDNGLGGGNSQISQFVEYETQPDRIATDQIYDSTLSSNLLAYFTLDATLNEYYGRTTLSASYNSQSVSFSNGPTNQTFALSSTGSSYPQLRANYSPLFLTGNMSLELLFRPGFQLSSSEPVVVSCGGVVQDGTSNTNVQYGFVYDPGDSRFYYMHQTGSNNFAFVNLPNMPSTSSMLNNWQHIIFTRNTGSREVILYMSGNRISSGTYTLAAAPTGGSLSTFTIGGYGPFSNVDGRLAQIRVYNKALSNSEVDYQYQQYLTASTIGYFIDNPNAIQKTRPFIDGGQQYFGSKPPATYTLFNQIPITPVAAFTLDNTLNDFYGNTQLSGTYNTSTITYIPSSAISGTMAANWVSGGISTKPTLGTPYQPLKITGSMSIEVLFNLNGSGGSEGNDLTIFGCASAILSENQSDNVLYHVRYTGSHGLLYLHESGSGANTSFTTQGIPASASFFNRWHHLVVVRDSSAKTVKLYMSGNQVNSQAYTNDADGGSNSFLQIGGGSGGGDLFKWYGQIANVIVYDRPLSAGQVLQRYNAYLSASISGSTTSPIYPDAIITPGFISSQHSLMNPFSDTSDEKIVDQLQTTNSEFISVLENLDINMDEDIRQTFNQKSATAGGDVYGGSSARAGTDSIAFRNRIRR
jgi:hypothetical protein